MRRNRSLVLAVSAAVALAAAGSARADDPAIVPVEIDVGGAAPIGPPPVRNLVCDDASIVAPVDVGGAPALKGLRPGTTLCSFVDTLSVRRVYRIVVKAPQDGGPAKGR